jgi:uncharacterized LabA/DUF88 family protein
LSKRVIVYVDGFNLYFGLREKGWRRYYWLDIQKLSQNLLKEDQVLVMTKYFTSRVSLPPEKSRRQATYIEALETLDDFKIYFGQYLSNEVICSRCGHIHLKPNEKMTDVNIAVELLMEAFEDRFDKAIIVSADSDLSAPIQKVREVFPAKTVVAAFPPARFSFHLSKIVNSWFTVGRKNIAKSVFPEEVKKKTGSFFEDQLTGDYKRPVYAGFLLSVHPETPVFQRG